MLCDWMSTEMNIAIDRHLKHTPRLVSQSSTASAAVLLKLDFEASPDLHIEEQLHRICRCFCPFSLRRCILRQPHIEFYHFWASWHHCEASSLLRAPVFLTTKTLLLLCLTLPGLLMHFFKHVPSRVILVPAFGWHTKRETTHQAVRQTFSSNSIVFYDKHNCESQHHCEGIRQTELPRYFVNGRYVESLISINSTKNSGPA